MQEGESPAKSTLAPNGTTNISLPFLNIAFRNKRRNIYNRITMNINKYSGKKRNKFYGKPVITNNHNIFSWYDPTPLA